MVCGAASLVRTPTNVLLLLKLMLATSRTWWSSCTGQALVATQWWILVVSWSCASNHEWWGGEHKIVYCDKVALLCCTSWCGRNIWFMVTNCHLISWHQAVECWCVTVLVVITQLWYTSGAAARGRIDCLCVCIEKNCHHGFVSKQCCCSCDQWFKLVFVRCVNRDCSMFITLLIA